MSFTKKFPYPLRIGPKGSNINTDMIAVGDGWISCLTTPDNRRAVTDGISAFNAEVTKTDSRGCFYYLQKCVVNLPIPPQNYPAFNLGFVNVFLSTTTNVCGLYVNLDVESNTFEDVNKINSLIQRHIHFYVKGEIEVDYKPATTLSVATPYITHFSINQFGYTDVSINRSYSLINLV